MRTLLYQICFVLLYFPMLLSGTLPVDDLKLILNEKPVSHYNISPTDYGLPATPINFIALNFDDELVDAYISVLQDKDLVGLWGNIYLHFMWIISIDSKAVDYDKFVDLVKSLEDNNDIDVEDKVRMLRTAYSAVASYRTPNSFEFIKSRTSFKFWEHRNTEHFIIEYDSRKNEIYRSGQTEAIHALSHILSSESRGLLKELSQDYQYTQNAGIKSRIEDAIYYQKVTTGRKKRFQEARDVRKEITSEEVDEIVTPSFKSTDSEDKESISESTSVVKSNESVPRESGNAFVLLIALLAILLVFGFIVFRKRKELMKEVNL